MIPKCPLFEGSTLHHFHHEAILHMFHAAMVNITRLPRNVARPDIECPGDTIPFLCSVDSNSETVQLRWLVTFPGQETITILYSTNESTVDRLDGNITTILTRYERDAYIESLLELTVLQNVSMNGTILECKSEDLSNEVIVVEVNTSGMFSADSHLYFYCRVSVLN